MILPLRFGPVIKSLIISFPFSIGLSWFLTRPTLRDDASALLLKWRNLLHETLTFLAKAFGLQDSYLALSDQLFGPYLFYTFTAFVFALLYLVLLKRIYGRCLVEYFWAGPPDIIDDRLIISDGDPLSAFSASSEFIGREEELRHLMRFAGSSSSKQTQISFVFGREGMGKTRLSLEWLKNLRKLGWDVGVLDPTTPIIAVQRAQFRRKTAIVLDDPTDFWPLLDALITKRQRICVLITNQFAIKPPDTLSEAAKSRFDNSIYDPLKIQGLEEGVASILAPNMSVEAKAHAEGRPLYLLLGQNPNSEINRRVARRINLATESNQRKLLLLAAMAGPFTQEKRTSIPGTKVPLSELQKLFEGEERRLLKRSIPALKPDIFSDIMITKIASDLSEDDFSEMIKIAGQLNIETLERRVGSLTSRASSFGGEVVECSNFIIDRFDKLFQHVGEQRRSEAEVFFGLTTSNATEIGEEQVFSNLTSTFNGFEMLVALRPWDEHIRLREAMAAVNATDTYGTAGRLEDLERWGARVIQLVEDPAFADDANIRLHEAKIANHAILAYGKAGKFEDLEKWGSRLIHLVEDPAFAIDANIRLHEANAAFNAIGAYGTAGRFEDLERWGSRLIHLVEDPAFADDVNIHLEEAVAAIIAVNCYGIAGRFEDLERWGSRLIHLTEDLAFAVNANIRLCEAQVAVNATNHYGEAGRFEDLERWGSRFINLVEDPAFADDVDIRLAEAKAVMNATNHYGTAGRFEDLERWGSRLINLVEDPAFADDVDIRLHEAKIAHHATLDYGTAGRFEDLERWGARLINLVEDPAFAVDANIRLEEAKAAFNAIKYCGEAGRFEGLERWGSRLIHLVEDPAFADDVDIRLEEAKATVNVIAYYGKVGRFEDLERWGTRLIHLVEDPAFAIDANIRLHEANAAFNAIYLYGKAGKFEDLERWKQRLARVAQAFPHVPKIQNLAGKHFVTYGEQGAKNWMAGQPNGAEE